MKWLTPWQSTENMGEQLQDEFARQLQREVQPGHVLYELPAKLIGRGQGDDALFAILDGTDRVAVVHLTWASTPQQLPWPLTSLYSNLQGWAEQCMRPEHEADR